MYYFVTVFFSLFIKLGFWISFNKADRLLPPAPWGKEAVRGGGGNPIEGGGGNPIDGGGANPIGGGGGNPNGGGKGRPRDGGGGSPKDGGGGKLTWEGLREGIDDGWLIGKLSEWEFERIILF